MAEEIYLTVEGRAELQRELDHLIQVRRPELARKLKEAVADGDLKENANYHDAKEQQAFVEGRIQYLQNILRSAVIVSDGPSDEVRPGSVVTIVEDGLDEEETYTIVGPAEAKPRERKISYESPIGAALLGRRAGERVKAKTPSGELVFRIKRIQ